MYGDVVIEQHAAQIELGGRRSPCVHMRASKKGAICRLTGLYTEDKVDTGSIVSDIGISYRPCRFLDIGHR